MGERTWHIAQRDTTVRGYFYAASDSLLKRRRGYLAAWAFPGR